MSKAFTLEENTTEEVLFRPLDVTSGAENYITPEGYKRLKDEVARLQDERVAIGQSDSDEAELRYREIDNRLAHLGARIESATVIDPREHRGHRVVFGSRVTVTGEDGERHVYQLVGTDEADAKSGKISWISPMAKALLRAEVGDFVIVRTPRGDEEFEVNEIDFPA